MPNTILTTPNLLGKVLDSKDVWEAEVEKTLERIKSEETAQKPKLSKEILKGKFVHPLDGDIVAKIQELKGFLDDGLELYTKIEKVRELWVLLIKKSIKALRFFDEREPYQFVENKVPLAYGIDSLRSYFDKYADFEGLLYGSNKSYRDHVIHVFNTWLLGIIILLNETGEARELFLQKVKIEGAKDLKLDFFEVISMWTIVAMCHDLGYPLEKAQKIFQKTSSMLEYFISNPKMSIDLNFSGVQDYINNHIVKFLSSKMIDSKDSRPVGAEKTFTGRVQPKYYIKLSKSLESYHHGIIGAIILYKTLIYFLETEFNVNEDYYYDSSESKQYYIRREILRAIASHTCVDIYHLNTTTLSFLLITCDDMQEWGRKRWIDFYKGANDKESIVTKLVKFTNEEVSIRETIKTIDENNILTSLKIIYEQFERYKQIFREGQDTNLRNFNFTKIFELEKNGGRIHRIDNVSFGIPSDGNASLEINFTAAPEASFSTELKKVFDIITNGCKMTIKDMKRRT